MKRRIVFMALLAGTLAQPAMAGEIRAVEFRPQGDVIALADNDHLSGAGTVRILDARTFGEIVALPHPQGILDLCFSADGRYLATSRNQINERYIIEIWKTGSWNRIRSLTVDAVSPFNNQQLAFVGKRKWLAIGRFAKPSFIWDFSRAKARKRELPGSSNAMAATTNGRFLAYSGGLRAEAYDPKRRRIIRTFRKQGGPLAFGNHNKMLALSREGRIEIRRVKKWRLQARSPVFSGTPATISFPARSKFLASVSFGAPVMVLDAASGAVVFRKDQPPGPIIDFFRDAALSPDGARIAAGTSNGQFLIWEVATGNSVAAITF